MTEITQKPEEFIGKYEETNFISKALIDNFYGAVESLLPPDITTVHEIGCGAGFSVARIKTFLPESVTFTASDIDPVLVDMNSKMNPDVPTTVESVFELPYEDNHFDLIFALEVLEHLVEPEKALAELKRVSKKYVLTSVPREPIWRALNMARFKYLKDLGNTPGHLNHWSTRGFKQFVASECRIEDVRTPLPWTMLRARVD